MDQYSTSQVPVYAAAGLPSSPAKAGYQLIDSVAPAACSLTMWTLLLFADIKLALLDNPASLDKAWDLTISSGQVVKKTSEIFVPPKAKLGGKFQITRLYELDDVAYGTSFTGELWW